MDGKRVDWVAVVCGTTRLRAWVMNAQDEVMATRTADRGTSTLNPQEFEAALLDMVGPDLPASGRIPLLASGIWGASNGWVEAPRVAVPCAPPGLNEAARPETRDPRLDIRILPAVIQAAPPDVMQGEATRIAGFLAHTPDFDGVLCLPGAQTRWVHVSAREIVSFRSFMTEELVSMLSRGSLLRSAVESTGWDHTAFAGAVEDGMSSPHYLTTRLSTLHTEHLLEGTATGTLRARLWGQFLGVELAGARSYWLGRDIVVIGPSDMTRLYRAALEQAGASVREDTGDDLVLAGLTSAYRGLST